MKGGNRPKKTKKEFLSKKIDSDNKKVVSSITKYTRQPQRKATMADRTTQNVPGKAATQQSINSKCGRATLVWGDIGTTEGTRYRHDGGFRVNVMPEEGGPDASKLQLFYPPLDFSNLDISVQLSFDDLQTAINVVGDDMDSTLPYIIFPSEEAGSSHLNTRQYTMKRTKTTWGTQKQKKQKQKKIWRVQKHSPWKNVVIIMLEIFLFKKKKSFSSRYDEMSSSTMVLLLLSLFLCVLAFFFVCPLPWCSVVKKGTHIWKFGFSQKTTFFQVPST